MFKRTLLLTLILSLFLSSFGFVDAARGPRSNLNWPPSPGIPPTILTVEYPAGSRNFYFRDGVDTPMIVRYFYEWMIVLGGLAAFIAFIWAGILYMTSVGDANKMSEAKKKIKRALLGLVLMMSSYLIFYTINPRFTTLEQMGIRAAGIGDLPPGLQDRINSFIGVYSQCLAAAEMRARGYITIPIPLLRVRYNPFPYERYSEIAYPHYRSFLGGTPIGNCEVFRNRVINRQDTGFPRVVTNVECVLHPEQGWIPPSFHPEDPSDPRIRGICMRNEDNIWVVEIDLHLVINRIRIDSYRELISELELSPFPGQVD